MQIARGNRMNEVMFRHNKMIRYFASIFLLILIVVMTIFFNVITMMRGDAAIINDMGKIRGNVQRLVKQEIMHQPNDRLIEYVDEIILTFQDNHHERLMNAPGFQKEFILLEVQWKLLQDEIQNARNTKDVQLLYVQSEQFFELSDRIVSLSQDFAEKKMDKALSFRLLLILALTPLMGVYIVLLLYSVRFIRKYRQMQNLAMNDSMTGLFNRNHFNNTMEIYRNKATMPDLTCVFFDLNNLKITNDTLGHDAGNLLLEQFSRIVLQVCKDHGMLFRYGGDEFIALLDPIAKETLHVLIETIHQKVNEWNASSDDVTISFAYGISHTKEREINSIDDLIAVADVRMYETKVRMKQESSSEIGA